MRSQIGAVALALFSSAQFTAAQECPPGYAKSGNLNWVDCPVGKNDKLQCATIQVPSDYTNPNGNKLELHLVRQPAAKDAANAKSIILNPGGPGASGVQFIVEGGASYQDIVGDNFHMVSFDPRGVGITTPYTCKEREGDSGSYNTDDGLQTAYNYNTAQAKDCAASEYADLIGTAFVARDIKAISEAVGEDGLIRYWGFSYGTLLGATLSAMFPDKMDRVILDGNINPTDYYGGLGEEGSADVDKGVQHFFDMCAEAGTSGCAVAVNGQSGKQLKDTFDTFLGTLEYFQSKFVRDAFYQVLYFKEPNAFTRHATMLKRYYGNPSSIGKRSLDTRQSDWKLDASYNDESDTKTKLAISGITCGDVVQRFQGSPEKFKTWLATYEKTSKYGSDIAISILYQCSVWTVDAKEKFTGAFNNIKTKTPILFLNSMYDPVTPVISAKNSAAGFVGARVLLTSGVGHCTTANETPELNGIIKTYMIDGTFPTEDKIYTPTVTNVFKARAKRTITGPNLNTNDVEYPAYLKHTAMGGKRAESIPTGCTKIAASSTPAVSSSMIASSSMAVSSTPVVSSTPLVSTGPSFMASMSTSASASPVTALSSVISVAPSMSSNIASTIAVSESISASSVAMSSRVSESASMSTTLPSSSMASSMAYASSSVSTSGGGASSSMIQSDSSSQSVSVRIISASMPYIATVSTTFSADSLMPAASSVMSSSTVSPTSTSLDSVSHVGPVSTSVGSVVLQSSYPTSVSVHEQGYKAYNASSIPVYGASIKPVYGASSAPSAAYNGYNNYEDSSKVTATPTPYANWSSQAGCIPVTQTYTKTDVETVTKCRGDYGNCQINSATPTVVVTKTKTGTIVIAVPTTTIYVTSIIDVCPTGLTTKTATITQTCNSGCTSKPTGIPQGYTTTVKYCDACAKPSTVTVTYCTACAATPTPAKPTPPPASKGPAATPAQASTPAKVSSVPSYNSQARSTPSAPPTVPENSKPVMGVSSILSKPFAPVGGNATMPAVSTSEKTMSIQTSGASTGAYKCIGAHCGASATSYTPAQFTGAAPREMASLSFVMPILFAGLAFFL